MIINFMFIFYQDNQQATMRRQVTPEYITHLKTSENFIWLKETTSSKHQYIILTSSPANPIQQTMGCTEKGRIITQPEDDSANQAQRIQFHPVQFVDNSANQAQQILFYPVPQIMGYTERHRIITQPVLRPIDFNQGNQGTYSYCYRRQYVPQPALL